jgi:hypothetical protein
MFSQSRLFSLSLRCFVFALLPLVIASAQAQTKLPGIKLDVSEADVRRAKPGAVLRVSPQIGGRSGKRQGIPHYLSVHRA